VLEGDPFLIVEAMTIAALATGCEQAYVYLRGEYPVARARLAAAIDAARAAGLLGADVAGRGLRFDIDLRIGAGAYICGEETAIFNSIEGYRGEPRNKPPFPVQAGLFGKPTVVNNVETLANLPAIVRGDWQETKLFCLSGALERPGVYEVPFGSTLGELIEKAGPTATVGPVLLGGAAGAFVGPDDLGLRLTFDDVRAAGLSLGSGVVMVFPSDVDLVPVLDRIAAFFRDESCGQCVPCRVGTVRQEEALHRLAALGRAGSRGAAADGQTDAAARAADLALLDEIARAMRDASICGLGQTAASAVMSALQRFQPFGATMPDLSDDA
jgi:NADH-quinone oxidoreductase subunit F